MKAEKKFIYRVFSQLFSFFFFFFTRVFNPRRVHAKLRWLYWYGLRSIPWGLGALGRLGRVTSPKPVGINRLRFYLTSVPR